MSNYPIATSIGMTEVFGTLLTGASMILTTHSLSRMIFLRRAGSRYCLFPIINIAQYLNQFCIFFLVTEAFGIISFETALWLTVMNNIAYFITKPLCMYLAYLRCSSVYPQFRKADWFHYFIIGARAVELFAIIIVDIIQNYRCDGSVAVGTKCQNLDIAWIARNAGAPVFRLYYIICEAIFYVKLFTTLRAMADGKNVPLIQYRRFQTTLFTVDLVLLVFMSVYRVAGIFDTSLPTYVYFELFSSTLTIFNLTEFGLNIRVLFHTVTDAKTESAASKMEMGSVSRHSITGVDVANSIMTNRESFHDSPVYRTMTQYPSESKHDSTSPLTSFAADTGFNSSEYDLSCPTAASSPNLQNTRSRKEEDHAFLPFDPNSVGPPSMELAFSDSFNRSSKSYSSRLGSFFQQQLEQQQLLLQQQQQLLLQQQREQEQREQNIISQSSFESQAQKGFNEAIASSSFSSPSSPSSPSVLALSSPTLTPKDPRRLSAGVSKPARALISSDR